jgi:hypothetical protein
MERNDFMARKPKNQPHNFDRPMLCRTREDAKSKLEVQVSKGKNLVGGISSMSSISGIDTIVNC